MKTGLKRTMVVPKRGFTLIELLVVVAIIAVLLSILLPSLGRARAAARATVCGTNLSHVGKAMGTYLAENRSAYPFSYIYPYAQSGAYDPTRQPEEPEYGYIHWSYFLYNKGQADSAAFECPEFKDGGAPRTNPGPRPEYWAGGIQQDHKGADRDSVGPDAIEDRQAPRVAFTGNAAIFPRNKFTRALSKGPRVNRFVQEHEIESTGDTILATELHRDWRAAAVVRGGGGGKLLSKSHRPINPFYHVGYGSNEYLAPEDSPGFVYGVGEADPTYGLIEQSKLDSDPIGLIDGKGGHPETNAVGRHHPGGDQLGGTANFLYVDGHVQRRTILQTLKDREWGSKYYALTGKNEVMNRYGEVWDQ